MAPLTRAQAWVLAARPRTLTAVLAPVLVGLALALARDTFRPAVAVVTLAAAVLIQIGTNIANDYFDFIHGADTADRLGALRVTQAGLLAPDDVRRGMVVVFAAAVLLGAVLVAVGGWPILVIGIVSVASGVAYTAGPAPLGYVGLGDVFTFVFFGPVAVAGTTYLQTGAWHGDALWAGVGVGALVTAILVVNNLRDRDTDARAGKRTLAVRIGAWGSKMEYVVLLGVGLLVPVAGWLQGVWPATALGALLVLPLVVAPLRTVLRFRDPRDLNAALGGTARFVGLYGFVFAAGLAL